jgi:hypothetical protein
MMDPRSRNRKLLVALWIFAILLFALVLLWKIFLAGPPTP